MGFVSYTEDDLDRWLESIRTLKDDLAEVHTAIAAGTALHAEQKLRAITDAAERIRRTLVDLEAAATHPWISSAHRSLLAQSRADQLQAELVELQAETKKALDARSSEVLELLERNKSLREQLDSCRKELREARKNVRAEHDATMVYLKGVKPLKNK